MSIFSGSFYLFPIIMSLAFPSSPVHAPFDCPVASLYILLPQSAVNSRAFHKQFVCTRRGVFAIGKYYYLIRIFYGGHLMRYHNNRLAPAKFRQRFVYKLLVLCICIRGSFIKDKYGSIFKEYSAYCYPLFSPPERL